MKKILKATNSAKTVLVILTLCLLTTNILLVQADPIGVGKYVNLSVIDPLNGEVTLTKLSSGETWITNNTELVKVGAGDVSVCAEPFDGYDFNYWLIDGNRITNTTYYFKTSKGVTEVEAHFSRTTYYIKATANGQGTINGTTFLEVPVEYNEFSPTFVFTPNNETLYHISSIQIDSNYIGYTENYTFPERITSNHTITVNFNDVGTAQVPTAQDVSVFLDSVASLFFNNTDGGLAQGTELFVPEGSSILLWDITTNASDTDEYITIALQFSSSSSSPIVVYRAESADALYSDVNLDGVVDGNDVSWVAQKIKTTVSSGAEYDPLLDIDRDGDLDEDDVHTVNDNRGAELTSLTFNVVGNIVYIETDHFSVFRCR
jgi:hypothetical protein